ncbi:FixH family protein [Ancylobacter sp. WKF20]|uniref:FixH family protein n=1 Tax=Ancylobacter sp. WKF20 TaxID=3039801 RepID=UPI00243464BE|nr:FixH family protein [Ancylobacter sp. WKF20]WGD28839.1 FixH family protein [Ancylobacter sp. WKF20]
MSHMPAAPQSRRDLWIPAGFVLFFVALAGLQLWFVLLANRTFTGLVTDPRPAGLAHGTAPATDWSARLTFTPTGPLAGTLEVTLADRGGRPLVAEQLFATAERTTRFPQLVPILLHPRGAGRFAADLQLPLAGPWAVRLTLTQQGATTERVETVEVMP